MAILADVGTSYGVIRSSYIRVTSFEGDKTKVTFRYACYLDQESRNTGLDPFSTGEYSMDYPNACIVCSAYGYLKENIFSGAVDA